MTPTPHPRRLVRQFVNEYTAALSRWVAMALGDDVDPETIDWRAPLERDRYYLPVGSAFISAVGLPQRTAELREFWPGAGPRWDALGVLEPRRATDGVLLVDVTPEPALVRGLQPAFTDDESLAAIRASLAWARERLGAEAKGGVGAKGGAGAADGAGPADGADSAGGAGSAGGADSDAADPWLSEWYHFASRLAHVAFFRERLGIPAWMVHLTFGSNGGPGAGAESGAGGAAPGAAPGSGGGDVADRLPDDDPAGAGGGPGNAEGAGAGVSMADVARDLGFASGELPHLVEVVLPIENAS